MDFALCLLLQPYLTFLQLAKLR